ncbi:MAG TPA: hypothetical protein VFS47_17620 [Steroidobacteraceae bacterium]|jgi:hypothetical protein|nr:hypothetical protein [Steroidobacteraceae bacterium]
MNSTRTSLPIGLWALVLGAVGFAAGFFGPILLNPDANQGPMLGIFITGPGGAFAGFILGALARMFAGSTAMNRKLLMWTATVFALGTLFFCLPDPKILGYVIDAEVVQCEPPRTYAPDAMNEWQQAVQRTTWYTPPADWKQAANRNLDTADGVVLTLNVVRRAAILQHRKPWDFSRRSAERWSIVNSSERYYANDEGTACESYLSRPRQLYTPFVEGPSNPNQPSPIWPPTDVTGFLRLMQLAPVPAEYRRLLRNDE